MEGKFSKQFTKQDLKLFFDKLKTYTSKTNLLGCNRLAYTLEDEEATLWLISEMQHYGLTTRTDLVGNVYARLPGKCSELPAVGTGSHIDTVPQGGDYDGVVGVLTGLYALLQYQPYTLKRDIELILFRAEESSRFGFSCIGSKSITGKIDRKKWQQNVDNTGNNVFDIIQAQGYAMADNITNENCELPEHYFDAFVEVHIEQGKVLESQKKRIGIVHGIAAPTRFKVVVEGHADHSGATPMDQRSDALVASAYIITNLQAAAYDELSFNTVGTVGKLDVQPNSMNVIPGNVMFLVDIRGIDQRSISRVIEKFMQSTKEAEHRHHCQITVHSISNESPVKLNNEICQIIDEICQSHAIPSMSIVSGAGHDSMNIADKCPAAMIFIPSKNGVSHHPEEYSQWHDIELSADLLTETIGRLANK